MPGPENYCKWSVFTALVQHFIMLQPYSKLDSVHFSHQILHTVTKWKKSLKFLQLIKTEILHLHKYSQLLLFRVELSCILFPVSICEMLLQLKWNSSVVNSWLDMIWKGKGPRVDSAHQRTNQAIKSEGLFYRILSRHRSGKDMEKLLQH